MRPRKLYKNTFSHCISQNLTDRDYWNLQGVLPDLMLDCSLPPGQPSNSLDGYRHLGELKKLSQQNMSVEKRAEHIQLDLDQNAKDLDARDPRSTVHAEMKSYAIEGRYIALVVGRLASSPGTLSRCATTLPVRKPARTTSLSTHRFIWRCRCSS